MSSKRSGGDVIQASPDLWFVKKGYLNFVILKPKKDGDQIPTPGNSKAFLDDPALIKSSTIDKKTFVSNCVFKVTLEFSEPMACVVETAVRETTDWVLCSCSGSAAFYSVIEDRLVLQQCVACLQSSIPELHHPFGVSLRFDGEQWVAETVFR